MHRLIIREFCLLLVFSNIGLTKTASWYFRGDITSVEWLEIPYATPLLAISYALIGVWGVMAFRFRKGDHVYVSQWYILAALFGSHGSTSWHRLHHMVSCACVVQSVTNWWFAHCIGLWFTPMALATVYYPIPKVLGRPIYPYYLSAFGLALAIFIIGQAFTFNRWPDSCLAHFGRYRRICYDGHTSRGGWYQSPHVCGRLV